MRRVQNDEAWREATVRATQGGVAGEGAIRKKNLFLPDSGTLNI